MKLMMAVSLAFTLDSNEKMGKWDNQEIKQYDALYLPITSSPLNQITT